MRFLAIDQSSTRIGWARAEDGGAPTSGVYELPRCGDNYGMMLGYVHRWLVRHLTEFRPDMLGFETPIMTRVDQTPKLRKLFGIAGHIEWLASETDGVEPFEATTNDIRDHFLGAGYRRLYPKSDVQKWAVIAECKARGWSVPNDDDNAADALALLDWMRAASFGINTSVGAVPRSMVAA